ncbi:LuxR C-terminal-related transcriptional regulator [Actinoplanes sp. CA-030573]|uniref:LuxR C-terminal-related transcriptional regulator n=1 Tax=Actinoplanes sp. CA-030573 TaxID=3239898 RepID=UPI003D8AAC94
MHGGFLAPLVPAKTARPRTLRTAVDRPQLMTLLDDAVRCPVTLVCAGAGWGKTMAVSAWARTRRTPVAWLSLDRHDNDPQIFWAYVLAALRVAGALSPANPLAALGSVPADERERTGRLQAGLAEVPAGTVLVLDDIHEIDDAGVLRELAELLHRLPPPLRVVLAGRAEPPLRLHRLRASGGLAEIRTGHLAFTEPEAAGLLTGHGLSVPGEDIATLVRRTEGWVTGLQLGAAFLAGHDGPPAVGDFAGDVRGVDDYLTEEVLATSTRRQRRFLLQTSICENVCAGLADAITRDGDGQRTLEQLERDNDFVLRLGAKPLWFRYHHLLRDLLGHRLLIESPGTLPELHGRAARWHAENHSVLEALDHAVAGGDWAYVGKLVTTQAAPLMVSAHRQALVKILREIPGDTMTTTPELLICGALLLFHTGDYEAIPARLDTALAMLGERPAPARESVEIMTYVLRLGADRAVGDMPAVIRGSDRLLELLGAATVTAVPAIAQNRAIALNNKGLALLWSGDRDEAERCLWAASSAARTAGVELAEINATGHLALLQAMSGSVHEAGRLAASACDVADRRGWRYALQTVAAHLARALVHIEALELDEARRALEDGLRAHHSDPEAAQRLVALGVQVRLDTATGDLAAARKRLAEAHAGRSARLRVPGIDRWLLLQESRLDLADDQPRRVAGRYSGADPSLAEVVCRAQAAYDEGAYRRAEILLAEAPAGPRDTISGVEAGILRALVADARGYPVQAADLLGEAVALAGREGIRRPLAAPGPRLAALLRRLQLLGEPAPAGRAAPAGPAVEGLSVREAEVLRYLTTMLTAAEIATQLGLSVNTVKAHMRAVYRKLGASRRSEAVALARENGLL